MRTLEEEKIMKTFMQIYVKKKTKIEEHCYQILLLSLYGWLKVHGEWFKQKKRNSYQFNYSHSAGYVKIK